MIQRILSKALVILYVVFLICGCSDRKKEWEKAKESHTIEAYEKFIQEYPKSQHINQAREQIAELAYERSKSINTIESYESFLQQYSTSKYADLVNTTLLELYLPIDFENAKSKNTIEGYKTFIDRHPNSPKTNEIYTLLEDILYTKAISQNTISDFEDYLECFPEGYRSQMILELLEPNLFKWALNENTQSAYLRYLKYFSISYKSRTIRERLELLKQVKYPEQQVESLLWQVESFMNRGYRYNDETFKLFDTYDVSIILFGDVDYALSEARDYILSQAKQSEESLLSKINDKGYLPADVVYYTKANQILLTQLSNYIISVNHHKKMLGIWRDELERKRYSYNRRKTEQFNNEIDFYNQLLNSFNEQIDDFNECIDLFYEKMQSFSALLPLEELRRYSYSDNTRRAEVNIQSTAFIYPLEDALSLLSSRKVELGSILLEAIGQIKIAYLGVLLVMQEDDYSAIAKFDILREDLKEYYGFVEKSINACNVNYAIHEGLRETLNLYRYSEGIFDYSIHRKVEAYYNAQTLEDIMSVFERF